MWYPSEVDVSIRPGWYYHASEDCQVKTPQKLIDIYYGSIGKNSLLLLNTPPDKLGLIHENDRHSLLAMKRILQQTFAHNYMSDIKKTTLSSVEQKELTDDALETYWEGTAQNSVIEITFNQQQTIDRLLLQETITNGQRIEEFTLEYWTGSDWKQVATGTTIGYKRIVRFEPVTSEKVRVRV